MKRGVLTALGILALAGFVGVLDRQSAEVTYRSAMARPQPIFESAHQLRHLHMPCFEISSRVPGMPITAQNTRCTKTDGRTE